MAIKKYSRTAFTVGADGHSSQEQITITLSENGEAFNVNLPKYVADRVTNGQRDVTAASLQGAVDAYESAMEAYQRWRLKAKASPMIMLMFKGEWGNENTFAYASLALWAEYVYVSEPLDGVSNVYARTGTTDNVLDFGDMGVKIEPPPTVVAYLPDNREVREKIKQLTGSMETAFAVLDALRTAPDKLVAFMNIGEPVPSAARTTETNPAQQSLPLDDPEEEL